MSAHTPQRTSGGGSGAKSQATRRAAAPAATAVSAAPSAVRDAPIDLISSGSDDDDEEESEEDSESDESVQSSSTAAAPAKAVNVDDLASSLGGVQLEQQPTPIDLDEALPYIDPGLFAPRAPLAAVAVAAAPVAVKPAQKPAQAPAVSAAVPAASSTVVAAPAPAAKPATAPAVASIAAPAATTAAATTTAAAPPRKINFPKPLANPLQQPIPTALKAQMAPPPAATAPKRTQPALHPDTLKDNPYVSSSVLVIESELRKQTAFLVSSASLMAGLPDGGRMFKLKVAQLEQALPVAIAREEEAKASMMQHEMTPVPLSHKPVAGSLQLQPFSTGAAAGGSSAEFGSAPSSAHPLFGSNGRTNKVQTMSLDSAADYLPQKGRKPQHGFYALGAISTSALNSASSAAAKSSAAAPVDEDDLLDLLNSLNQLQVNNTKPATKSSAAATSASAAASSSAAAAAVPAVAPEDDLVVPGLKSGTKLLPHQVQAVRWMQSRESAGSEPRGGIIADDCGLGKTLQMLALMLVSLAQDKQLPVVPSSASPSLPAAAASGKSKSSTAASSSSAVPKPFALCPSTATLIICPKAVLNSWRLELSKHVASNFLNPRGKPLRVLSYHGPERSAWRSSALLARKADVVLTTYETVMREPSPKDSSGAEVQGDEFGVMGVYWRRIVLDESHHLRNPKTETARALCTLLECERRWCMSATPLQNHMDDLYTSFWFLHYSPYSDLARWKSLVSKHSGGSRKGLEVLRTLLSLVALRRTKTDRSPKDGKPLVQLPEKVFKLHRLDFTTREKAFYAELYDAYQQEMQAHFGVDATPVINNAKPGQAKLVSAASHTHFSMSEMLVKLLRLRQACDHYLLAVEGMRASAEAAKLKLQRGPHGKRVSSKRAERRMEEVLEQACAKIQIKVKQPTRPTSTDASSSDSDSGSGSDDSDSDSDDSCGICLDSLPSLPSLVLTSSSGKSGGKTAASGCSHSFCLGCLKPLLEEALASEGSSATLPCPKCGLTLKAKDFKAQLEAADAAATPSASKTKASAKNPNAMIVDYVANLKATATPSASSNSSPANAESAPTPADLLCTSKLDFLCKELHALKRRPESARDKVIVFSQWTSMLDLVQLMLDREQHKVEREQERGQKQQPRISFHYTRLDGSQSSKQQHASLMRFQGDDDDGDSEEEGGVSIFLLSLAAGGTGLNLTAANHLFLLDLWWNPGIEQQAFDRVYRVGQTKPVFIHKMLMRDTVEEALYDMQQRKLQMAFGVMDAERKGAGAGSGSGGADLGFKKTTTGGGMTMQELKAIFMTKPTSRRSR